MKRIFFRRAPKTLYHLPSSLLLLHHDGRCQEPLLMLHRGVNSKKLLASGTHLLQISWSCLRTCAFLSLHPEFIWLCSGKLPQFASLLWSEVIVGSEVIIRNTVLLLRSYGYDSDQAFFPCCSHCFSLKRAWRFWCAFCMFSFHVFKIPAAQSTGLRKIKRTHG